MENLYHNRKKNGYSTTVRSYTLCTQNIYIDWAYICGADKSVWVLGTQNVRRLHCGNLTLP